MIPLERLTDGNGRFRACAEPAKQADKLEGRPLLTAIARVINRLPEVRESDPFEIAEANVGYQVGSLVERSSVIGEAAEADRLNLIGAISSLPTASVEFV